MPFIKQVSSVLITGANHGLGQVILNKLLLENFKSIQIGQLYITARDTSSLSSVESNGLINKTSLDLFANHTNFETTPFYQMLTTIQSLELIFYCASPYYPSSIKEAPKDLLDKHASLVANNIVILTELLKRLSPRGVLIVIGAVGSERIHFRNSNFGQDIGNIGHASLHALHKGHLKDLVCCLHQAFPEKCIKHLNISAFKDEVMESERIDILSIEDVANQIIQIALFSTNDPYYNIDILAPNVLKKVQWLRSLPNQIHSFKATTFF